MKETKGPDRRLRGAPRVGRSILVCAALVSVALGAAACGGGSPAADKARHHAHGHRVTTSTSSPTSTSTSTTTVTTTVPTAVPTTVPTTTVPSPPTTTAAPTVSPSGQPGPITEPPLPAPGPGFVTNRVTAIGDSVMIDYQQVLEANIPGAQVTAAVSRQWTQGEAILEQLKSEDALGAVVIVGLSTNGPINETELDSMMQILTGASRVVFVNIRVDRTWQTSNNAVLASGVSARPRAVIANWCSLAEEHPTWLYATQTHLPIDGTGARALAALVAGAA